MQLSEPSPNCVVCGTAQLNLSIHTSATPLSTFIDKVLRYMQSQPTLIVMPWKPAQAACLQPPRTDLCCILGDGAVMKAGLEDAV